jgi:hypothetical protein
MNTRMLATLLGSLLLAAPASADDLATPFAPGGVDPVTGRVSPPPSPLPGHRLEFHADFQTVGLWRSDRDFTRDTPYYDHGQSAGAIATILTPRLTLHVGDAFRIHWEAEVGLNYWSRNNPDEADPTAADVFVLKQREIYGEGTLAGGRFGFKVGYQRFLDTTGLFVNHWLGAAQAWWNFGDAARVSAFFAQVPDNNWEGITIRDNNFDSDIFVFGARADVRLAPDLRLSIAVHDLWDSHVEGKRLWVVAPNARLAGRFGFVTAWIDGVLQYGNREGAAVAPGGGLDDQTLLAWAWQAHAAFDLSPVVLTFNVFATSPDDAEPGNERDGTFLYSGKNASATSYLTEDEVRDWYDNLDERLAAPGGEATVPRFPFYMGRAGLLVGDARAAWTVAPWFRPALTIGAASVLKAANALGNRYLGTEADLALEFRAGEHLVAHVIGGVFIPGKAASVLNRVDPAALATDTAWWTEASVMLRY